MMDHEVHPAEKLVKLGEKRSKITTFKKILSVFS